jgi:hypothetical protein
VAAHHPKRPAKNANGEYATFEAALSQVLSVPRSEIQSRIQAEKRKPKRASASRASTAKD